MIPRFPSFKAIEPTDRAEVEAFTRSFPPYSDFNFLSLLCWDTQGAHALSWLHGNLVVRFSDYVSGTPFYSFLGTSSVRETAENLIALSARKGLAPVLRLVPEATILAGGCTLQESFLIEEDADSHDYVLDIEKFFGLNGRNYKNKRYYIAAFRKNHPRTQFVLLDLDNPGVRCELWSLWECWKESHETAGCCRSEQLAFTRALEHAAEFDIHAVGMRIEGRLAGFNFYESIHGGYSMGHYGKTDRKVAGMSDLLEHETARIMGALGCTHVNIQQDLGLPGMRAYKRSLKPSLYLRKYTLRPMV